MAKPSQRILYAATTLVVARADLFAASKVDVSALQAGAPWQCITASVLRTVLNLRSGLAISCSRVVVGAVRSKLREFCSSYRMKRPFKRTFSLLRSCK